MRDAASLAPDPSLRMPLALPGMRIGLFGGSFDPPHPGHRLVAETAMRRLELDRLWWLVSPGNPLKRHDGLRPLAERLAASRALMPERRIDVTGFEAAHRLRYTADLIRLLARRRPHVRFVWVMGADSLRSFHLWQDWRDILRMVPVAVVDRPGATLAALHSPMAIAYRAARLAEADAALLPFQKTPAWVFLHGPRSPQSSTALRASSSRN
ncbi:putative nicotinate-nucleotide adenylyltransferase [Aureimonas endophytica]|uniref:Probable nicotinate-nucleotide adenylyltransferase n=1 Tax=Aureimonas endophytica TaxID=2027858 RepID=A0A917E233_9HYPH|nr:nicotinate-nucleotide adenylyltransferase [Aureimonas endophytica]GGD97106.1 putative nicotinate-nucleotide adenylyltransferase [Aureimonas endophytica]